ncbi:unnamed protein product [Clavelina lepadiformis]|uniref:EGF-like domain-containing protein n=1 Tax=Clavelina lepadiformis TaxID=159417 RepID=A0ABP0GKW8_CLALP
MNVLLSVEYACSTSLHPCHPNATCIDVFGLLGFVQCKCKPGYNQTASYQTFVNNPSIIPDGTYCPISSDMAFQTTAFKLSTPVNRPTSKTRISPTTTTEMKTSAYSGYNQQVQLLNWIVVLAVFLVFSIFVDVVLCVKITRSSGSKSFPHLTSERESRSQENTYNMASSHARATPTISDPYVVFPGNPTWEETGADSVSPAQNETTEEEFGKSYEVSNEKNENDKTVAENSSVVDNVLYRPFVESEIVREEFQENTQVVSSQFQSLEVSLSSSQDDTGVYNVLFNANPSPTFDAGFSIEKPKGTNSSTRVKENYQLATDVVKDSEVVDNALYQSCDEVAHTIDGKTTDEKMCVENALYRSFSENI